MHNYWAGYVQGYTVIQCGTALTEASSGEGAVGADSYSHQVADSIAVQRAVLLSLSLCMNNCKVSLRGTLLGTCLIAVCRSLEVLCFAVAK